MKPLYRMALYALLLNDCEAVRYQNTLREMAKKQIREYQQEDSTYKAGVDFMTNEPRFRLRSGEKSGQRSIDIVVSLIPDVESSCLHYYDKI